MPITTACDSAASSAPRSPRNRSARFTLLVAAATCLLGLSATTAGAAEAPVELGDAESFAILAGAGITNTGATTVTGDIGTFPTTSQTGFGTITQTGVNHAGDAVTQQAKDDLVIAYDDAAARPVTATPPVDLAGQVLTPGVYNSGGTIELSGTLTLDAQGDPNAVFVFQTASTLVTASASTVDVINTGGADSLCNVFWQVGSSATLGSTSTFVGTILALTSITLNTAATVEGRVLARNGAVTLDNNTITNTLCAAPTPTPTTTTTTTPPGTGTNDGGSGSPVGVPIDAGGTPTDAATPPTTDIDRTLAFTGSDHRIALLGAATLLLGLVFVALSSTRRRSHL